MHDASASTAASPSRIPCHATERPKRARTRRAAIARSPPPTTRRCARRGDAGGRVGAGPHAAAPRGGSSRGRRRQRRLLGVRARVGEARVDAGGKSAFELLPSTALGGAGDGAALRASLHAWVVPPPDVRVLGAEARAAALEADADAAARPPRRRRAGRTEGVGSRGCDPGWTRWRGLTRRRGGGGHGGGDGWVMRVDAGLAGGKVAHQMAMGISGRPRAWLRRMAPNRRVGGASQSTCGLSIVLGHTHTPRAGTPYGMYPLRKSPAPANGACDALSHTRSSRSTGSKTRRR